MIQIAHFDAIPEPPVCPLHPNWRSWGVGEARTYAAASPVNLREYGVAGGLDSSFLKWATGPGDIERLSPERRGSLLTRHIHAECTLEATRVHFDAVKAPRWEAVFVFVEGEPRGAAFRFSTAIGAGGVIQGLAPLPGDWLIEVQLLGWPMIDLHLYRRAAALTAGGVR